MSLTLADRVAAYLDGHTTLNLATTGPAGLWVAAVLYVHEGPQLYFTSVGVTRHGQNLRATGMAAGTINDDCTSWLAMKGLQLEGTVAAVDAELPEPACVAALTSACFSLVAGDCAAATVANAPTRRATRSLFMVDSFCV